MQWHGSTNNITIWKFVYYRLHVLVCIFHDVFHQFICEKKLNNADGTFSDLAARQGSGLFLNIFTGLLLWVCSLHFHSIFIFLLDWVYSIIRSACGGALSKLLSFRTSSRVIPGKWKHFNLVCIKIFFLVSSVFILQYVYTPWASMFSSAAFRKILLPSSGNIIDYDENI